MGYGSIKRSKTKSMASLVGGGHRRSTIGTVVSRTLGVPGSYTATACFGKTHGGRRKAHVHCGLGTGKTPTHAIKGALRDLITTLK